jgi:hypothetical protein
MPRTEKGQLVVVFLKLPEGNRPLSSDRHGGANGSENCTPCEVRFANDFRR